MTKDAFILNHAKQEIRFNPSCFIIDEIGLTGSCIFDFIKEHYKYSKIYMLGDPLQLINI